MKYKAILTSITLASLVFAPAAFAQEVDIVVTPEVTETVAIIETPLDPIAQIQSDLAELQSKESDPETGPIARFFLRIKIREMENKLKITEALQ